MKNNIIISIFAIVLFSGCAHEFNQVYKSQDYNYKYEYAKECFAYGKYTQAITLLEELVTIQKEQTMLKKVYICLQWHNFVTRTMKVLQ